MTMICHGMKATVSGDLHGVQRQVEYANVRVKNGTLEKGRSVVYKQII
jgi:hypothetical protein